MNIQDKFRDKFSHHKSIYSTAMATAVLVCSWEKFTFCIKAYKVHFLLFPSSMKRNKKHVLKTRKYMLVKIKLSKLLLLWKKNILWWKSARQLFLKWRTNSLFTYSVQKPSTAFRHKTPSFFPCGVRYA